MTRQTLYSRLLMGRVNMSKSNKQAASFEMALAHATPYDLQRALRSLWASKRFTASQYRIQQIENRIRVIDPAAPLVEFVPANAHPTLIVRAVQERTMPSLQRNKVVSDLRLGLDPDEYALICNAQ